LVALLQADGNPAEAGAGTNTGALPALRMRNIKCRGPLSRTAVADPATDQEEMMRALGYVTAITLAVAGIALGVLAVKALPETRRYLAMRKI
jgi:hypothetical protein